MRKMYAGETRSTAFNGKDVEGFTKTRCDALEATLRHACGNGKVGYPTGRVLVLAELQINCKSRK